MTDFAAAPVQPIVEGIVTFPGGVGTTPVFTGKGISSIIRDGSVQGSYILFFDVGLPGNAGAVPALPELPFVAPPDPDVRTLITPFGVGAPPLSNIATIAVSYIASLIPGVGAPAVNVVLTNLAFLPRDPVNGFLIVVWRGIGGGSIV